MQIADMTPTQARAFETSPRYYQAPNFIDRILGEQNDFEIHAGSAGNPVPATYSQRMIARPDRFSILDGYFEERTTVAEFATADEMIDWLRENGRESEPGLPAFYNGWD